MHALIRTTSCNTQHHMRQKGCIYIPLEFENDDVISRKIPENYSLAPPVLRLNTLYTLQVSCRYKR